MQQIAAFQEEFSGRSEAFVWVAGLAFTFTLFYGIALLENNGPASSDPPIEDLRTFAIPLAPPPPPPSTVAPPQQVETVPLSGIDIGASDSPVRIAVVPPDLEYLVPSTREPPRIAPQLSLLSPDARPRVDVDADVGRVYQVSEVDRRPQAILRIAPPVRSELFERTKILRVDLLLLIDAQGRAVSARLLRSSGFPEFDNATIQTVQERWEFAPAMRRGKKVKCLAQQVVRVTMGGGSPFSL